MSNRIIILVLSLTITMSTIFSCTQFGINKDEGLVRHESKALMSAPPPPQAAMLAGAPFEERSISPSMAPDQKIMRSANISVEVDDIEDAAKKAKTLVEGMNGMISDSSSYEDDAGIKSLRLTLKIPSDKLNQAIESIKAIGRVRAEDLLGEDITEQYIDMEARLANAKRLEQRLVDLLQTKTVKLKDLLDVEKELARVREEIESMEGRKRFYDSRVSMATVQVTFTEPRGFGRGIFEPLSGCIQRSLTAFTSSIVLLIIVVSAVIPWAALFLLLAWLMLRFLRFWIKHKRAMKEKKGKNE